MATQPIQRPEAQPVQRTDRQQAQSTDTLPAVPRSDAPVGEGTLGIALGLAAACAFYLFAWAVPFAPIQRYFLGHPVAVAATILFAIGGAILLVKALRVSAAARVTGELRDDDVVPAAPQNSSSSDHWLLEHDAGRVAKQWLYSLGELPQTARNCPLVVRLCELLQRQSGRSSTRHLSDDLREVSAREADSAHDSLQLVRIIVWAIPMLGFLGTVIGITQTLGGLDFTDGTAAVDRLKSGLYVAFDTTALGLVLSVIAIFLQFPVERAEQRLLADIDRRVGSLLAAHLPSDDTADNPAAHISLLCDGIRVAVGQSLASQAELWRTTIDAAHTHWERIAGDHGQRIGEALMASLGPALHNQASSLAGHSQSLRDHAESLAAVREAWNSDLEDRWQKWTDAFARGAELLTDQQRSLTQHSTTLTRQSESLAEQSGRLADQTGILAETSKRAEQLSQLQRSLDGGLLRLTEANAAVQHSLQIREQANVAEAVTDQMADAMLVLARAVDVLSKRLPPKGSASDTSTVLAAAADHAAGASSAKRRAA
jgi:biopolymer transport protein ExbB/TolQ